MGALICPPLADKKATARHRWRGISLIDRDGAGVKIRGASFNRKGAVSSNSAA